MHDGSTLTEARLYATIRQLVIFPLKQTLVTLAHPWNIAFTVRYMEIEFDRGLGFT